MPQIETGEVSLFYTVSGQLDGDALVLGNSLGSDLHMWDRVLPGFEKEFRVVRFDMRGHGRSSVPPGSYRLEDLGKDVLCLLDRLGLESVHFCGLSLGGMVAMWLGIHAPERVTRLVMANTSARIGTSEQWDERIAEVERSGMTLLAENALRRWFTDAYREQHAKEMETIRAMIARTDPEGYVGCCGALRDADLRGEIARIAAPSLVIAGKHDTATPPSEGWDVHRALPHSNYLELDASHLSAWEQAERFALEVNAFLKTAEVCNG